MKGNHFIIDDGNDAIDRDRLGSWPGLRPASPTRQTETRTVRNRSIIL
jgi:hypothetical protein